MSDIIWLGWVLSWIYSVFSFIQPAPYVSEFPLEFVERYERQVQAELFAQEQDKLFAQEDDWLELLSQYNWNVNEAYAVIMCESGGRADAVSSAGAVGLFQIHPYNPANFDPATNVAAAYRKWTDGVSRGNRWWHWNQFGSCGWF